jgi:hypothetical protein
MSLKYSLYEASVQTPDVHVSLFKQMFFEARRRHPLVLREDFCGTFAISRAWAAQSARHRAIGVDLSAEPLKFGHARLARALRKRVKTHREDVCTNRARSEIAVACNFSFCTFKDEKTLTRYFRNAHRSLTADGLLVLEIAGGPGMIEKTTDRRRFRLRNKIGYTYFWEQSFFDPVTHDARYAIHFQLPNGKKIKNAFTYDWRLWTIPELRRLLKQAGFDSTCVYWEETDESGGGSGVYRRTEEGSNDYAWVAYVVGVKRGKSRPHAQD